jgi:hypothetical protein
MTLNTSIPSPARSAITEAVQALEPHLGDARVAALARKLEAIGDAYDQEQHEEDREASIAKSMVSMAQLSKAEGSISPNLREQARKADLRLQLIHLHRNNPDAAREWIEQRVAR